MPPLAGKGDPPRIGHRPFEALTVGDRIRGKITRVPVGLRREVVVRRRECNGAAVERHEANVHGRATIVPRSLHRIGDVRRVGQDFPHLALHRARAVAIPDEESISLRSEDFFHGEEPTRGVGNEKAARGVVHCAAQEVVGRRIADVEQEGRLQRTHVDEGRGEFRVTSGTAPPRCENDGADRR